ncbi:MAG: YitT family protein [Clostridiaceae bacterium]|jgi:uncharacterized membrane-anchored protein YitT (DUF2179 family)|nr:YitT family protein [Clostridiaceae bacterium]
MKSASLDRCWQVIRSFFYDAFGSFMFAIGVYNFAAQADFAPGGVTGIAIILNKYTELPIGLLSFAINIPLILIALRFLGKRYLFRTFVTVLINTLFLDIISPMFPVYQGNPLLASLFAGILSGFGLVLIYQNKSCTGGSDLVVMTMRKIKPHMSVGQITMVVDGIIVIAGGFVFHEIDAVLYGIIYSIAQVLVIDKVMFGFVSGKIALIVTEKNEEVIKAIGTELGRGSTLLMGKGGYSKEPRPVILCACSRSQIPVMRRIVRRIDPDTLMMVLSYDEVYGEGFLPIEGG